MRKSTIPPVENKPRILGIHTAAGHLQQFNKWKRVPFLRENEGRLPPFIISVGSRARVLQAPSLLNFSEYAFIDERAREEFGLSDYGRVSILIGLAESKGGPFPLMVAESQMGCPAAQINVRELLDLSSPYGYRINGKFYSSDGIYIIRAGTCAGVNSHTEGHKMKIGDLAIATTSIGSVGAILQSKFGVLDFAGRNVSEYADDISSFTNDACHLSTSSSEIIIEALSSEAKARKVRSSTGPNFTKDSLYAEMGEEEFSALRDEYGVISTEMEQIALDSLAEEYTSSGIPTQSGLIAAVVGAIPGKSFPETAREKKAAANAEKNALLIAKEALSVIAGTGV